MIQNQIDLPLGVAVGIVKQGIRIRFGRSLVTLTGIILGIAFMMSNLAQQIIREGVREEDQLRAEVQRMYSFLTAEIGLPEDRAVGVAAVGELDPVESRFLKRLAREGAVLSVRFGQVDGLEAAAPDGADVDALIVLGKAARGTESKAFAQWDDLAALAAKTKTFSSMNINDITGAEFDSIDLSQEPRPEEIARLEAIRKKEKFRRVWILIISVLVTVMGIANAMLMSVTERFREIGTMKCLGAKSSFVRRLFLIESSFLGVVGGILGALLGAAFSVVVNAFVYGPVIISHAVSLPALCLAMAICVATGVALSVIAALYPAGVAAAMTPAHALRSNV